MVKEKDSSKGKEKAAQIKKIKKAWIKNDVSQELEKYDEDLKWFEDNFPNRRSCEEQLLFWLGWKKNLSNANFVCPACKGTDAISGYKAEGRDKKLRFVFRCKNENCGRTPSPRSQTIMVASRIPLKFWFLSIYTIGLMNGEVPWSHLNQQRKKYKTDNSRNPIQVRDMATMLYKIIDMGEDVAERMRYCRLVHTELKKNKTSKSYRSWYKSNSWGSWRIAFQKNQLKKASMGRVLISEEYEDGVRSVYMLKDRLVQEYEWLLIVRVNKGNKVIGVQWMYVSAIEEIDKKQSKSYKDGYRYVASQTKEHSTKDHPFEIGVNFKKVLSSSISLKILDADNCGDVEAPSTDLLEKMYNNFPRKES